MAIWASILLAMMEFELSGTPTFFDPFPQERYFNEFL